MTKKHNQAIIEALARGETPTKTAEISGVSVRTVHRRLSDPEFMNEVRAYRSKMITENLGKLTEAGESAISTLVTLLSAESDSVKLGASRAILKSLVDFRGSVELSDQIAELRSEINAISERRA